MAIDISKETLISLNEARQRLPARRKGKRPDLSCVHRWCVSGCSGVRLEFIMVGATRCTSLEAIQRFFDRLTAIEENRLHPAKSASTAAQRPARSDRAQRIADAEHRLDSARVRRR